ncbi:phage tail assembly chaperone [Paraburkholderia sp. BR10923]|uniref:phage tail assembly chaperone n=1 Tax=Paraburkholderia sp. BR10923 TaxID=3236992 RepID=UPI0034CD57A4
MDDGFRAHGDAARSRAIQLRGQAMDQAVKREVRREEKFSIDDVRYVMVPGNAADAIANVRRLGPVLADVSVVLDAKGHVREMPFGRALAHLHGEEADEVLDFIMQNTRAAVGEGAPFSLGERGRFAAHFGTYPDHWVQVVHRGFVFQFARFFPGGNGLFQRILDRAQSLLAATP